LKLPLKRDKNLTTNLQSSCCDKNRLCINNKTGLLAGTRELGTLGITNAINSFAFQRVRCYKNLFVQHTHGILQGKVGREVGLPNFFFHSKTFTPTAVAL